MRLEIGRIIEDRYAVEAPLGTGGMASVWRVRRVGLGTLRTSSAPASAPSTGGACRI